MMDTINHSGAHVPLSNSDTAPTSFVQVLPDSPFSLQNLPFGIGKPKKGDDQTPRVYSRIGNYAVDISVFEEAGYFKDTTLDGRQMFKKSSLEEFISAGPEAHRQVQEVLADVLRFDRPMWLDQPELRDKALTLLEMVEMQLPMAHHETRLMSTSRSSSMVYHLGNFEKGDSSGLDKNISAQVPVKVGREILLDHHGDRMLPEMQESELRTPKEAGLAYLCGPRRDAKGEGESLSQSKSHSNQQIIGVTAAMILTDEHPDRDNTKAPPHIFLSPWVTLLDRLTRFISPQTDDGLAAGAVLEFNVSVQQLDNHLNVKDEHITQVAFPIGNPVDIFSLGNDKNLSIQSGDLMLSRPAKSQPESPALTTMHPLAALTEGLNEGYVHISAHGDTGEIHLGTGGLLIRR